MALALKSPGVERQDVFLKPAAALATGVPGFVGFAEPKKDAAKAIKAGEPFWIRRKQELADNVVCDGFLNEAVAGFFDNGGERCYVAGTTGRDEAALKAAIDRLASVADLDLVAVPDAMMLALISARLIAVTGAIGIRAIAEPAAGLLGREASREATLRVQRHAVAHCAAHGDRLVILDALPGSDVDALLDQRKELLRGQQEPVNAVLYYPWLRTIEDKSVPPSGAVAGIFARTDARVGVHKAPANEEITGVLDLETDVDAATQDRLNPAGINCLRAFPGRGIRVWGARTISRDPAWRYVNVRRLVLTLRRWIALNLAWAGFEPNGPLLWVRIERELRGHLTRLWLAGALSGASPDAAFYIKCNSETNPPERRDSGEVVTEIGLAPNPPAEFVVIRIAQLEGAAQLLAL
jgi:uncharacterized protein